MFTQKLLPILFFCTATLAFAADAAPTSFIQTCCNTTSYPSLCVNALSPYAATIRNDSIQLALVATNVSLPAAISAAKKSVALFKKAKTADPDSRAAKALKDCNDVLRDAMDNTKYSMSQLSAMNGAATVKERLWMLSNAQTYMSAALTKEDTCVDGLNEMGTAAKSVNARVVKAKMYTSNALGLVNRLHDAR